MKTLRTINIIDKLHELLTLRLEFSKGDGDCEVHGVVVRRGMSALEVALMLERLAADIRRRGE